MASGGSRARGATQASLGLGVPQPRGRVAPEQLLVLGRERQPRLLVQSARLEARREERLQPVEQTQRQPKQRACRGLRHGVGGA